MHIYPTLTACKQHHVYLFIFTSQVQVRAIYFLATESVNMAAVPRHAGEIQKTLIVALVSAIWKKLLGEIVREEINFFGVPYCF